MKLILGRYRPNRDSSSPPKSGKDAKSNDPCLSFDNHSAFSADDGPCDLSSSSSSSLNTTDQLTGHSRNDGDDTTVWNRRKNKPSSNTGEDHGINSSIQTRQKVRQVKLVIVLVLLISIAGAVAVFFYTQRSEQTDFESQFIYDANKVLGSLLSSMERRLNAFNLLSTSFVTIAEVAGEKFPFVRIPHFAAQVGKTIQLTNSIVTYLNPIIRPHQRTAWEEFASENNTNIWNVINDTLKFQRNFEDFQGPTPEEYNWTLRRSIYNDYGDVPYNTTQPMFLPEWQIFPLVMRSYAAANFDWTSIIDPVILDDMIRDKKASISRPELIEMPDDPERSARNILWCAFFADFIPPDENCFEPMVFWYYPVVDKIDYIDVTSNPRYPEDYEVKAFIIANLYWKHLIRDILPPNSKGIVIVFEHHLYNEKFTYQIDGPVAKFLGGGDKHDPKYDNLEITRDLFDLDSYRIEKDEYYGLPIYLSGNNTYTLHVYPSDEMKETYTTNKPIIFAVSAVMFILLPFAVFLVYDRTIQKQQDEIIVTANQSHAIVSSLFPSTVRDQLLPTQNTLTSTSGKPKTESLILGPPIAELYPDTTVLFCDVVHFTKWSSVRDPSQVFTLLESIYCAFDAVASRRNVFKVETIGDCYVAVAGLPDPRRDHAEVMARFAADILRKMADVTAQLGKTLGPGTSTLQLRVGLNSGPTTAGVLRGSKGRFQLFGDTVNTAARMESNSAPGKILCSQKTADILIASGKERWIVPRTDFVDAKGKGLLKCYWVQIKPGGGPHSHDSSSSEDTHIEKNVDLEALNVTWLAEMFVNLLNEVVSQRNQTTKATTNNNYAKFCVQEFSDSLNCPRDEVSEMIQLPKHSINVSSLTKDQQQTKVVYINDNVRKQIHEYIAAIAKMYRVNPFHNFYHASHVVMATRKLLNRIVKPTDGSVSTTAHGITSDPLTQFGIIFSALIHDVDHPGVSNAQLVKENDIIAVRYRNKSVAEQNSVALAWKLLMDNQFQDFRDLLLTTESETRRFRQLIVNAVMATDLFDSDLNKFRETRWSRVFDANDSAISGNVSNCTRTEDDDNRRATIIIEHIIQASDVSHTMQHWHVYQEWNRRLFNEVYKAYVDGRVEKDPSVGWYDGELWFFDNYIIPLAKKLEMCGVFGVSCGELLDYAQDNRAEWATKGQAIVLENLRAVQAEYDQSIVQSMATTIQSTIPVDDSTSILSI